MNIPDECMTRLVDRVQISMNNAKENGYDISVFSADELAIDLLTYDPELEGEDIDEVATAIHIIRLGG